MTRIKLKRAYDNYDENDGLRVLVDRLWPRGVKKEALHYDLWAKDIAPSDELRKWMHADKDARWSDFPSLYEKELTQSGHLSSFIEKIKAHDTVTLLYAAKDTDHNNAAVLKDLVEKRLLKV